jgi:hypothetical protein
LVMFVVTASAEPAVIPVEPIVMAALAALAIRTEAAITDTAMILRMICPQ